MPIKKAIFLQNTRICVSSFLYRYFNLSTAQRIFAIKTRWINNQATIPQDYLFGIAPMAQAVSKIFLFIRLRA